METVGVEAESVGHVAALEPVVSVYRGGKVVIVVGFGKVVGERGWIIVTGEVEVHVYACGDEELVRDGVFVGCEVGVPDHATVAERGVPAFGGEIVENAGSMRKLRDELLGVPHRVVDIFSRG